MLTNIVNIDFQHRNRNVDVVIQTVVVIIVDLGVEVIVILKATVEEQIGIDLKGRSHLVLIKSEFVAELYFHLDHVERKVPKYENHKLRERKVKTVTRN